MQFVIKSVNQSSGRWHDVIRLGVAYMVRN